MLAMYFSLVKGILVLFFLTNPPFYNSPTPPPLSYHTALFQASIAFNGGIFLSCKYFFQYTLQIPILPQPPSLFCQMSHERVVQVEVELNPQCSRALKKEIM